MPRRSLSALVLALGAAAAACGSPPRLTESQEYYVGRGVAANAILETGGIRNDEALERYVNAVGQTVAQASDRPETYRGYHFAVLESDVVNAFAAPGGFVFVTTAALKRMGSEDELAGVLAHEIAHLNLRHPEEHANHATQQQGIMDTLAQGSHLTRTGGMAAGSALSLLGYREAGEAVMSTAEALAAVVKGFGNVIEDFLQEIMVNGYSRDSELAADALAVDLLTRPGVGYDPAGLRRFIKDLPPAERGAWSSHPRLEGRLKNIDEVMKSRGIQASTDPARTARFRAFTAGLRGN
jgi:predicted Zn-dependent protease